MKLSVKVVFIVDYLSMLIQVTAVVNAHEKRKDFMKAFLMEFSGSVYSSLVKIAVDRVSESY